MSLKYKYPWAPTKGARETTLPLAFVSNEKCIQLYVNDTGEIKKYKQVVANR